MLARATMPLANPATGLSSLLPVPCISSLGHPDNPSHLLAGLYGGSLPSEVSCAIRFDG